MAFGFAPPMQMRPMMQPGPVAFPTMNLAAPGPAGYVPQVGGGKPIGMADIRSGLQKLGIGGPPPGQAAANQAGYSDAVRNTTGPVSYTPPADPGQINWGSMMGSAMGAPPAAAAGADAAGASAAGGAAAAGGGADIGKFLMAFLGL